MGFLVIARKIGEGICIGDGIEIRISDINYKERRVDIAVKAPTSTIISRKAFLAKGRKDDGSNIQDKHRRQHRQRV